MPQPKLSTQQLLERLESRGRVMPKDLGAEQALLGSLVVNSRLALDMVGRIGSVTSENTPFFSDEHTAVYMAIARLVERNEPVDLVTVAQEVRTLQPVNVAKYPVLLTELATHAFAPHAPKYWQSVEDKHRRRQIILGCERVQAMAMLDEFSSDDAFGEIEQTLYEVRREQSAGLVTLDSLGMAVMSQIERASKGLIPGVATGIAELDGRTNGWQPADLVVIAARPSRGKTALGIHFALSGASSGTPTALFSLEMKDLQIARRFYSHKTGINAFDLKRGSVNESDWDVIGTAMREFGKLPLFIDDQTGISPIEIKAKLRRHKPKIGLLVVDYVQLMSAGKSLGNREQEVSYISKVLKGIAKDLDIPVLALAQLNKENIKDKRRPRLSDLRESDALGQDADVVILIHHDADITGEQPEGNTVPVELIIEKNRDGPVDTVHALFDKTTSRFSDMPIDFTNITRLQGAAAF